MIPSDQVKCDRCGVWTTFNKVKKAKWFEGFIRTQQTDIDFPIDAQGDIDEVVTITDKTFPKFVSGWVCVGCQCCVDTYRAKVDGKEVELLVVQMADPARTIKDSREFMRPTEMVGHLPGKLTLK